MMKVEATAYGDRKVFSVSAFNRGISTWLQRLPTVWVEGEVTELRRHPRWQSVFFTLKDPGDGACLGVSMPRGQFDGLRLDLADGDRVHAYGRPELYAARGEFRLRALSLERFGLGDHLAALERLKKKLAAEGLFAASRKRPLPRFPRKIGIVTSPSGAAIRDMLRVIGRRFGEIHIVLAPARVQGEGAAAEVAQGIRELNALGGVDVIIVGRGGGSLEDLWAFNDEMLARTIAASKIPVISAVGHEVDFTIADFVADVRAATPSNAAELVVKEKRGIVDALGDLTGRLQRVMRRGLAAHRDRLERALGRRVLTDPGRPLRELERRLDDARVRLRQAALAALDRRAHRVELAGRGLRSLSPVARTLNGRRALIDLQGRLERGMHRALDRSRHRLGAGAGRLDSLSPLAVLSRGYSLTRTADGRIVRTWRDVAAGDAVNVLLHHGSLDCRVDATRERDDRPQV